MSLKGHLILTLFLAALTILGIQTAGGAWNAAFDGHPDESGQFVTGLMVYDYVTQMPAVSPLDWAIRYYLHYPKIGLGRWPPGFALMETLWWLIFKPSRFSTILLEGVVSGIAAILFYRLVRDLAGKWLGLGTALLLICSPVVVSSYTLTMADAPCLLWGVLVLDAAVRILRRARFSFLLAGFWLICALLTKGTGVCLIPVPVLALLLAGKFKWPAARWLLAILVTIACCVSLYLILPPRAIWMLKGIGGIGSGLPWRVDLLPALAGPGVCVLAAIGMFAALRFRREEAVAAAAMVISILGVSFVVRAMQEPRHWIIALPPVLLLGVGAVTMIGRRSRWLASVAAAIAVVLVPFRFPVAGPSIFGAFVPEVRLPARMLVAGNGDAEGPWIAAVALAEKRPSSVIMRGTKVLASMGWDGEDYRLLFNSAAEVEARLDRLRVSTVVLYLIPGQALPPHCSLLKEMLRSSPAWKLSARNGPLSAWRRELPAKLPPERLEIDLGDKIGRVVRE